MQGGDYYDLNYVLINIIDRCINLESEERKKYEKRFNYISNRVIEELLKDEDFGSLFKNRCLSGSYANNLKIKKPDEFDLLLELELPMVDLVVILPDNRVKSFCKIQITKVLNELKQDQNNLKFLKFLESISIEEIDSEFYLDVFKFQDWFGGLIVGIVDKEWKNTIIDKPNNVHLSINCKPSGPAATIGVEDKNRTNRVDFNIDFVPAFIFGTKQWIAKRPWTEVVNKKWNEKTIKWHALPKPISDSNGSGIKKKTYSTPFSTTFKTIRFNTSFLTSYTPLEDGLIKIKPNIKTTIKLFKLLRDRGKNSSIFKSYFIKTLFLWKIDEEKNNMGFWDKNIGEILILMIENVIERTSNLELHFFWDDSFNMSYQRRKEELNLFRKDLERALKKLKGFLTAPKMERPYIVGLFIDKNERIESGVGESNKLKKSKK